MSAGRSVIPRPHNAFTLLYRRLCRHNNSARAQISMNHHPSQRTTHPWHTISLAVHRLPSYINLQHEPEHVSTLIFRPVKQSFPFYVYTVRFLSLCNREQDTERRSAGLTIQRWTSNSPYQSTRFACNKLTRSLLSFHVTLSTWFLSSHLDGHKPSTT